MKKNYDKLVKIAYLNPKYRNAFFMLLGTEMRIASSIETITENAKQGIFDNYTLGVMATYFSSKGTKFPNPNPEGGKDQIAMSTLVNYYNERNTNPEYGKFARDTISTIQRAFNMFYADYERRQKIKPSKEKTEETDVDDLEIVSDEEQNLTYAQKIKRDSEIRKNKQVIENKILKTLDEVGFKDETELETFYDKVEEKFFTKRADGKLYLRNNIEDNEKTRDIVKKVLRNKLDEKEIEEIFNETKESKRSWLNQKTNNIQYSLAKIYVKSKIENYENTAHLIVKGLSFVKNALDDKYGELQKDGTKKINWKGLPSEKLNQLTKDYFDLLDEKYNSELNAGVRLSMRKNSKFIIDTLKSGLKDSQLEKIATDLSDQVVKKVTDTEIYGQASETAKKYLGGAFEDVKKTMNTYINEPLSAVLGDNLKKISRSVLTNTKFINNLKEDMKDKILKSISPDIDKNEISDLIDSTISSIKEDMLSQEITNRISSDAQDILYSNNIESVVTNTQHLIKDSYNSALDKTEDIGATVIKTITSKTLGAVSKFLEKKGGLSEEGKTLLETGIEEKIGVDLPKFGLNVDQTLIDEFQNQVGNFKENMPIIPTSVEVSLKEKISTEISTKVEQSSAVDNFQDSLFNTVLETAVVTPIVSLLRTFVVDKAINKTYFERLEKETDKKTRFEQEFLTFSLTPEAKEDEYKNKTKEILESDMPLEKKIEEISSLVKDFDANVRPAIAKALYGLGKRDATGVEIEGNLSQLGTYVFKRASEEFDFNKMFITASEDDQITNRMKELFASKKDSSEPPSYINMKLSLDKLNVVKAMEDHVKDKLNNPNEDRVMDVITGKKPFGPKTFEKLKKRKIQNLKNKKL